jgi:hypothetical protein
MTLRVRWKVWAQTIAMLLLCGTCGAGDLGPQQSYWPIRSPQAADSPKRYVTSPPGSDFYPQYRPYVYPPYVKPAAVSSYSYGYFGARYHPTYVLHSGYYGDLMQWSTPRGF